MTLLAALAAQADDGQAGKDSADDAWWKIDAATLGLASWDNFFRLGRWQAAIDLGADGNYQATREPDRPDTENWSRHTGQGVTVRNLGYSILDPRLLTGNAIVRFGFRQIGQSANEENATRVEQNDITDYYIDATILTEKPYNTTLLASRSEFVGTQSGGGTTASATSAQAVTVNLREDNFLREREWLNFFGATLQARQEHVQQVSRSSGNEFRLDEDRRRLMFDAHNGFESGDLNLRIEDIDLTNRLVPASSYRSRYVDLGHSQDFGKFLDHQSTTNVNYSERDGGSGVTSLNADQRFDLKHSDYLSSNYGYLYSSSENDFAKTTAHFADAYVNYTPFGNVSTGVQVFGNRQSFDPGTVEGYGTYVNASYDHWLPGEGNLTASVGGGYSIQDSQSPSGNVPVIDERYLAPPQLGAGASIELRNPDIVVESIVVFNVRGGSRLLTVEGVDYQVVVEGTRTLIVPLASSAIIQPGDPLEISYLYLVDADLKASVSSGSASIVADWQWFAVSYTHDQSTATPISGATEDTLLGDQKRDRLRFDLRGDWDVWEARADNIIERTRDTRLRYDEVRTNASVTWQPTWVWSLNMNAGHSDTHFLDTGRTTRMSNIQLGGSWTTERGWWGNGSVSYRTLDDSEIAPEELFEARVQIRRSWPVLDFALMFGVGERTRGSITNDYADVHVSISRQFR